MHAHLSSPKYRPDIDGLRAVAVLSVVVFHAFPNLLKGGFIGVDVFFVISGYLISTIIYQNLDKGTFRFTDFYSRRIKRIFPALLLVLAGVYLLGWWALLSDEFKQLGKHIASGASFISNIVLWRESGYFDNSADTKPLLHLWSLGVEEQFYIVYPLLLWGAWKNKINLLKLTVFLAALSFYLNITGIKKDSVGTFLLSQTRFWELMCGSLLAWLMAYKKDLISQLTPILKKRDLVSKYFNFDEWDQNKLANAASILGFLLLLYGFFGIDSGRRFPGGLALIPVLSATLIIAAGQRAWVNREILSRRLAVWFGLISFPLYLWHWPMLSFARIIESETPSPQIRIVLVALSVFFAWLTYRFVERPIRSEAYGKSKVAVLVALMCITGWVGYWTFRSDGFEMRNSVKGFVNNKNELVRTPMKDEACLNYVGIKEPLFPYCRFMNVGGSETIAVIGDSHAHVAFPGIAEVLKEKGKNTVLLANSACPPFLGVPTGKNLTEKRACQSRIEQLLEILRNKSDIKRVFFFARGPVYVTGKEPVTGEKELNVESNMSYSEYFDGAQNTINSLVGAGKSVYFVTENPELKCRSLEKRLQDLDLLS